VRKRGSRTTAEQPARVEALTSWTFEAEAGPMVVKTGDIFEVDDPTVQRFPDFFAPAGLFPLERQHLQAQRGLR
jgi:hypothetical protein